MNKLHGALLKRSSIDCFTAERRGIVRIEFYEEDDAIVADFLVQLRRCIQGDFDLPEIRGNALGMAMEPELRARRNFLQLIEITQNLPLPFPGLIKLEPVNEEEGSHIEWRYRLSWEFESGPQAAELFQRLLWFIAA